MNEATYWLINLPFLVVAGILVAAVLLGGRRRSAEEPGRIGLPARLGITLGGLLLLTAVFDNVIVGLGIVGYDESLISGVLLGLAPIEDFAYAVVAALGLPALWLLLPERRRGDR